MAFLNLQLPNNMGIIPGIQTTRDIQADVILDWASLMNDKNLQRIPVIFAVLITRKLSHKAILGNPRYSEMCFIVLNVFICISLLSCNKHKNNLLWYIYIHN